MEAFTNINTSLVFTEDKYGELPDKKVNFLPLFYAGSFN